MKFTASLLSLITSLSVFADCSVYSDPQKAIQYYSQVGQEAWMNKYMQCMQNGKLQAIDISAYQKMLQQMNSNQASQLQTNNQFDNSASSTVNKGEHFTQESNPSGAINSQKESVISYGEEKNKSDVVRNIKSKDGRDCISLDVISSEAVNHNQINKYNTTFEITNICSEAITVRIEDSGVSNGCIQRAPRGSRTRKSCWTISKGKKVTYSWEYNPNW